MDGCPSVPGIFLLEMSFLDAKVLGNIVQPNPFYHLMTVIIWVAPDEKRTAVYRPNDS